MTTTSSINTMIEPGIYPARIINFRGVRPEYNEYYGYMPKPYIEVTLDIGTGFITDRIYKGRANYITFCLKKQFGILNVDCTLGQLLKAASKNGILIQLNYNSKYGQQVEYNVE